MKPKAHIEDWRVIKHPTFGCDCLEGVVTDHPNVFANSWARWDRSTTSPLVAIDVAAGQAETCNTQYTLGRAAQ